MIKIVDCDERVIEKIPSIIGLLHELFGSSDLDLYAVLDNDELSFVARNGFHCVYINKDGYKIFMIDSDYNIVMLKDEFEMYFGEDNYFVDDNKNEYYLDITRLDEVDEEEYDGNIIFRQYNPSNDVYCDIRYQQMYRVKNGFVPIYEIHTREIDVVEIIEQYNEKKGLRRGLLTKSYKTFSKIAFNEEQIGYKLMQINDFGLIESIRNKFSLMKNYKEVRYVKSLWFGLDDCFHDLWPFAKQYNADEIREIIVDYGLKTSIPSYILDTYNNRNDVLNKIRLVVKEMKKVKDEMEIDDNRVMKLKLFVDSDE